MRENPILVAVGSDEAGINPVIKVWKQDKLDMQGEPFCVKSMRAIIGNKPASVSAFRVNDSMNMMAVGFDDGRLLLVKGDISRTTAKQSKHIHLTPSATISAPITGIEFQGSSHIFVVTTVSVYSVPLNTRGLDPVMQNLDNERGCKPGCSAITEARRDLKEVQLIIGCRDALYLYQHDGIGPCLAFDAEKELVSWFRNYLVCVIRDNDKTILNIYDINNKYVAYSTPLIGISHILPSWGGSELVIVTKQGKIFSLTEKATEDRLGVLFRKNQYELAVKLANSNNYDGIVDIFRQYGDHLYAKGEHDLAVAQYIKTIGKLEESYVIRKLLDAQKIKQLTDYLQELHKQGLAKEDHTTLLINCYTNINKVDTLSKFIQNVDLQFDAEIAIKVCRSSELYHEALLLAEKHKKNDYYLKIQIEDMKNFTNAIRYIERLPFKEAEENLEKYGKVLMDNNPEQTTNLLCRLCTNYEGRKSRAEKFIHIFVNNPKLLKNFLQQIMSEIGEKIKLSPIIYNTLLELELQEYRLESQPSKKASKETEIMCFLREKKNCYDTDLALGLCQINNFKQGILHLYEKAELYHQILSFYTEKQAYNSIIDVCTRFGNDDPSLWRHALLIFAHAGEHSNTNHYFMLVLDHIEKHSLLPAIMVVSIAAQSKTATLSLVKEFLVRHLSGEGEKIRNCEQAIKQYKKETEALRTQMDEVKHKARVFQESKCSGCKIELELPSVHFLCGHSFHVNCFENFSDSSGCPSCAPENNRVAEKQRQMEEAMETLNEDFAKMFNDTDDVLGTVADFLSRGVFKTVDPLTEATLNEDSTEFSLARIPAAKPKSLFERPTFPCRVVPEEPAARKSVFDKPDPFRKPVPSQAKVSPAPKRKPALESINPKPQEETNIPFRLSGEEGSDVQSFADNNPFQESLETANITRREVKTSPPRTASESKPATVPTSSNPFDGDVTNPFGSESAYYSEQSDNPFPTDAAKTR
ncbi:vacuolar protein sorting-associated protein 11 homolog [Galendromus occidentalis]|uniref:Vacuolar protein sorting-associated protein 11 homolog n=1 Tax=Galendromus occidentalis TaxID=34638 RepID=A0AAJ7SCV4_9ACAR|nr:vacuolar protein sorting-associated protein 11 homolog [Galendromus occidentalis]